MIKRGLTGRQCKGSPMTKMAESALNEIQHLQEQTDRFCEDISRITESLEQTMFPRLKEPEKVLKAVCDQSSKHLPGLFKSQCVSDSEDMKTGKMFFRLYLKKKLNSRKEFGHTAKLNIPSFLL